MKLLAEYNAHIKTLFVIGGFFGFSMAILAYMISPYLQMILDTENVSVWYLIPEVLVLICFGWFLRAVSRFGKLLMLLCVFLWQIVLLAMLNFFEGTMGSVALVSGYLVAIPFIMMLLDMLLEAHSSNGLAGRVRGMYILWGSAGFLLGPIVAGFFADRYGFSSIFFLSMVCYAVMFLLTLLRYLYEKTPTIARDISLWKAGKQLWVKGDVFRVYMISVLLEAFYSVTVITIPLYLANLGLTLSQIGLIFTVMLIPFILLPYPAGRIADLRWGEKEILIGAMILIGLVLLVVSQTAVGIVWVWMALLFLSRVGASLMETMRDAYYFKVLDGQDISLVSFFRTSTSAGILLSSMVVFLSLYFGGTFQMIYIFYAVLFFLGVLLVFPMKDTEPER